MQRVRTYLTNATAAIRSGKLGTDGHPKLRIVVGNTSCDMDSVVGALTLGFYYSEKTSELWVPVVNCRRADFYCNLEIVKHLENCKISQSDLYFIDELREQYPNKEQFTETALVDHNLADPAQAGWMDGNVTRIVDHHIDNKAYADTLVEKECRFIGSACSLVAMKYLEDKALFAEELTRQEDGEPNLAYLLAAAIVLDTYNFKEELRGKKWQDEDAAAHKFLSEFADVGTEYWQVLNSAKFDVEQALELGLHAIFIRDYKTYDLLGGRMGAAVATGSIATLMGKFGPETFAMEMEKMLEEKDLGIFAIVSIQADQDGKLQKGLLLYRPKEDRQEITKTFDALVAHLESIEDFKLHEKQTVAADPTTGGTYIGWQIGNHSYTRKAFEALVKKYYASLA